MAAARVFVSTNSLDSTRDSFISKFSGKIHQTSRDGSTIAINEMPVPVRRIIKRQPKLNPIKNGGRKQNLSHQKEVDIEIRNLYEGIMSRNDRLEKETIVRDSDKVLKSKLIDHVSTQPIEKFSPAPKESTEILELPKIINLGKERIENRRRTKETAADKERTKERIFQDKLAGSVIKDIHKFKELMETLKSIVEFKCSNPTPVISGKYSADYPTDFQAYDLPESTQKPSSSFVPHPLTSLSSNPSSRGRLSAEEENKRSTSDLKFAPSKGMRDSLSNAQNLHHRLKSPAIAAFSPSLQHSHTCPAFPSTSHYQRVPSIITPYDDTNTSFESLVHGQTYRGVSPPSPTMPYIGSTLHTSGYLNLPPISISVSRVSRNRTYSVESSLSSSIYTSQSSLASKEGRVGQPMKSLGLLGPDRGEDYIARLSKAQRAKTYASTIRANHQTKISTLHILPPREPLLEPSASFNISKERFEKQEERFVLRNGETLGQKLQRAARRDRMLDYASNVPIPKLSLISSRSDLQQPPKDNQAHIRDGEDELRKLEEIHRRDMKDVERIRKELRIH